MATNTRILPRSPPPTRGCRIEVQHRSNRLGYRFATRFRNFSRFPEISADVYDVMRGRRRIKTDFLTASSGFLTGMGSVSNVAGNYAEFNGSDTDEEADRMALEADWAIVGQDFYDAMQELGIEVKA